MCCVQKSKRRLGSDSEGEDEKRAKGSDKEGDEDGEKPEEAEGGEEGKEAADASQALPNISDDDSDVDRPDSNR